MNHQDHVKLIKDGIPKGGVWADLGSGRGAFTLALADCLGTDSHIYSVDIDRRSLDKQKINMEHDFPKNEVTYLQADFTKKLDLPPLDGIIMANSLHFIRDKQPVLASIRDMLKVDGRLIMVEYDMSQGNSYVPYPFTFAMWVEMAKKGGFKQTELLATRPSSTWGQIFSALSYQ